MNARGLDVGSTHLGVRPNRISFVSPKTKQCLRGDVLRATYVGNHLEITVETSLGTVFVTTDDVDADFQAGAKVGMVFAPNGAVLLAE